MTETGQDLQAGCESSGAGPIKRALCLQRKDMITKYQFTLHLIKRAALGNQLESTGINWNQLEINWNQLESTGINWNQLESTGINWKRHTEAETHRSPASRANSLAAVPLRTASARLR